jgi:hypothetical protein
MRSPAGPARAVLLLGALAAAPSAADDAPIGWHVIRPGDTLEGLSVQFLGDSRAWQRLHELNPRILDPHWIFPGRRVRVPIARPSVKPNAQLTAISNRVEAMPAPVEWLPAEGGDLLLERDGLRTFAGASARLLFDDGSVAVLSEESLVFIRRQTPATAPAPRKEIEIELGQAEFETRKGELPAPEIEVVVGSTRSTMRTGAAGAAVSRHRKSGESAQVMLYKGAGEVQGAAGSITLAEGSGTTVSKEGRPAPPEKLLPAPLLLAPADRAEPPQGAPIDLMWREVAGAAGYRIELCSDAACALALASPKIVTGTSYRLASRPRKLVYWRITAVGSSGLDGYPSPARQMRPSLLVAIQ